MTLTGEWAKRMPEAWIVERLDAFGGRAMKVGRFEADTEADAVQEAWSIDRPQEFVFFRATGPLPTHGPAMLPPGNEYMAGPEKPPSPA